MCSEELARTDVTSHPQPSRLKVTVCKCDRTAVAVGVTRHLTQNPVPSVRLSEDDSGAKLGPRQVQYCSARPLPESRTGFSLSTRPFPGSDMGRSAGRGLTWGRFVGPLTVTRRGGSFCRCSRAVRAPAMLVGQASACLRLPREDRLAWRLVTSPEAVAEVSQYGQATPLHSPALRSSSRSSHRFAATASALSTG